MPLQEKPKVEKVISGGVKQKEKSTADKIIRSFIPEDAKSVKDYILFDVLVPTIKRGLDEAFHMLLFNGSPNEKRGSSAQRVSLGNARIPYHDLSSIHGRDSRQPYEYNDIIFDDREDALAVLYTLDNLVKDYGMCSVQDLFSAADLECNYTANNWGWYDIHTANVIPVRGGGYTIDFPRIQPLK